MAVHPTRASTFSYYLSSSSDKIIEPPETQKASQSIVSCLHQASIGAYWRNVTIMWSKNLMNYSMSVVVDGNLTDTQYTCKVDLKPWHFWSKKGFKAFDVEGAEVEVYWDLRSAKFSTSPEPISDYYVALVSDGEVVLLLGDMKKKVFKRTKSRPALVHAVLCQKTEHVFAKRTFSTRAVLDQRQEKVYDIVVESSTIGHKDPEMWISIDGVVLIHVKNLQWKFRGNQTVMVNKQSVQVFWDVHDWLFVSPCDGHGMFIFKPIDADAETDAESANGSDRNYHSAFAKPSPDYCLFLYAWKIE
uniref:DUF868 family protein n=1 Tax=Kalanchoe fedtschenkoi TaxID=63787 RepID=A0A7N0RA58_KALFE